MKRRGSVIWLIIFLGAIIFGLYSLWGYNWHLRQTENMQLQIESLKNKINQLEVKSSPNSASIPSIPSIATASAKPSALPTISPIQQSTNSGTIKKEGE
jgi:hypothetical protein